MTSSIGERAGRQRGGLRSRVVRRTLGRDEDGLLGVVELTIADISDRGWEQIRFHVQDREEELVAFFAAAYEESVVESG